MSATAANILQPTMNRNYRCVIPVMDRKKPVRANPKMGAIVETREISTPKIDFDKNPYLDPGNDPMSQMNSNYLKDYLNKVQVAEKLVEPEPVDYSSAIDASSININFMLALDRREKARKLAIEAK